MKQGAISLRGLFSGLDSRNFLLSPGRAANLMGMSVFTRGWWPEVGPLRGQKFWREIWWPVGPIAGHKFFPITKGQGDDTHLGRSWQTQDKCPAAAIGTQPRQPGGGCERLRLAMGWPLSDGPFPGPPAQPPTGLHAAVLWEDRLILLSASALAS